MFNAKFDTKFNTKFDICMCVKEDSIKYACALIYNILADSKMTGGGGAKDSIESNKGYTFHIFTNKINEAQKLEKFEENLKNTQSDIKVHIIDDKNFADLPIYSKSFFAYYKLKMIDILIDLGVKYALFLESSTFINCDIRELFSIDLSKRFAAASIDSNIKNTRIKSKDSNLSHIIFNDKYFSTNVMLLNLDSIKSLDYTNNMMKLLEKYELIYPAEDVLNAMFKDNILLLDSKYVTNLRILSTQHIPADSRIYYFAFPKPWEYQEIYYENMQDSIKMYIQKWWGNALQTPVFKYDLKHIKELNESIDYNQNIDNKIDKFKRELDPQIRELSKIIHRKSKRTNRNVIIAFIALFALIILDITLRF